MDRDDEELEPAEPRGLRGAGFALLGETLLVGVVVLLASVPVVTAVPALAAGARHLRRHLVGEADGIGDLARDVVVAVRDLWVVGFAVPVLAVLLAYDVWLARTGVLPGGTFVVAVSLLVAAGVVAVVLRLVAAWTPGDDLRAGLRTAGRRAREDLGGSMLLVVAVVVCGVLVWMLLPLVIVVGGLLSLAALAVEARRTSP